MNAVSRVALAVAGLAIAAHAGAQVTFYEHDGYRGRSFTIERGVDDFEQFGFSDRPSSVVVQGNRADRWELCEDRRLRGRCVILRHGDYPSLAALGLAERVTSVRLVGRDERIEDDRYAPAPATPVPANHLVFSEFEGFRGRTFTADAPVVDLRGSGFDDRASSAVVSGERWEVCQDARYSGRCVILRHGEYPSLSAMGLNDRISSARAVGRTGFTEDAPYAPPPVPPSVSHVVFYENEGFQGRSFKADTPIDDFRGTGFNDRASSVVVRGQRWEVCEDARYGGRCVVLRPGQYPSLSSMGLNDGISSLRAVGSGARIDDGRYSPLPLVSRDYGRRNDERLFEADITSVRAVVEDAGQRCWVEREQVNQDRSRPNVPGALLGAVIGGILGHQVGGGSGRDVATGIGVVAGAAIGSSARRSDGGQQIEMSQNVQRCRTSPSQAQPAYWDVTYNFRGQEYRLQMTTPPGATVTVNERGEPRA